MKKTFVLFSILFSIFASAQELPINEKTGKVSYEAVLQLEGMTASQIYIKGNEWFAKAFNSANDVIQMNDKEVGKIIGKGIIPVSSLGYSAGSFHYTISLMAKEGRCKYVITDIYHDGSGTTNNVGSGGAMRNIKPECGTMRMFKKYWKKIKIQADENLKILEKDLVEYMKNQSSDEDDW